MARIPYENNIFVGSSVIVLIVVGCIIPLSVVSIFGFSPQTEFSPPPYTPEQQGEIILLSPPPYQTIGNGTPFDTLVNETVDPVSFLAQAAVVEGDSITVAAAYPSGNITLNETQAITIATNFVSSFEYIQNVTLAPSAYLSNRIPCWIVDSEVEGGSVSVWINAVSGIVCFYMVNVDLQAAEDTDLRLYFSGATNVSLEIAGVNAVDFLQHNNYTLVNGSKYDDPYFKSLPPGNNNEGFVNGEYIFQIYGMHEGIFERSNKVQLQIEASTGAVVYFSYLWTAIPEYPEVDIIPSETAQNAAVVYLHNHGINSATLEYPNLILDAEWYPDMGYSGSIYWQVSIEDAYISELRISPISGRILGSGTSSTASTAIPTGTASGGFALMSMGFVFIIPLSSFCLGLAGYMIMKNKQSKRILSKYKNNQW